MSGTARTLFLAALLLTAGLAGCIGGEDDAQDNEPQDVGDDDDGNQTPENETEPEDLGPTLTRTWFNATIEGGSAPNLGYYCSPGGACDNTMEFEVPDGTEAILVEAAWEEDANAWLNVSGPECQTVGTQEICQPSDSTDGGSPLSVLFEDERTNVTGTWDADIWVDETTPTEIQATMVATVVTEGQLPSGYTALDAAE